MKGLNFKHFITIVQQVEGIDEDGWPSHEWQEFTKVWADIKTMKGHEFYGAATTNHVGVIRFITRYIPGIKAHMQIEYNGQQYDIESIANDDGNNRTITIIAKARLR